MLKTPVLSPDQIDSFSNNGYVILPGGFDAEDIARIDTCVVELENMPEVSGRQWVYHEKSLKEGDDTDLICRIENIAPFHPGIKELTRVLKAPVDQLLGEEAVLFKEKINFKMPGGDGFKPHQDSQAGWDTYAEFFISVLVCIDEATVANGCLQMVAGEHKRGLFRSWEPLTEADMQGKPYLCYSRYV